MALLEVKHLKARFYTSDGIVNAVNDVSFTLDRGQVLGLVGESGSGKSTVGNCIMNLLPKPAGKIESGEILLDGDNLVTKTNAEMLRVRGEKIGMIVQDPMSSLDPLFTIGDQITETIRAHEHGERKTPSQLLEEAIRLLKGVRIPAPENRVKDYPHQFSGGMRQRAVGAIALSCHPQLIIADEPTTSLDVTIQAQYLELLKDLQKEENIGILFITHDLGIVTYMCTDVAVMYAGHLVEKGKIEEIYDHPAHPYTQALIDSVPRLDATQKKLVGIDGAPPRLINLPQGCPFAPRCKKKVPQCDNKQFPPKVMLSDTQEVHCWRCVN